MTPQRAVCVEIRDQGDQAGLWSQLLLAPPVVQWVGWKGPPLALNLVQSQLQPPVDTQRSVIYEDGLQKISIY